MHKVVDNLMLVNNITMCSPLYFTSLCRFGSTPLVHQLNGMNGTSLVVM